MRSAYPTNNAPLTNFLLSSDAEIFVDKHRPSMQIGDKRGKNVRATCTHFRLSFHFACHRCWLGTLSFLLSEGLNVATEHRVANSFFTRQCAKFQEITFRPVSLTKSIKGCVVRDGGRSNFLTCTWFALCGNTDRGTTEKNWTFVRWMANRNLVGFFFFFFAPLLRFFGKGTKTRPSVKILLCTHLQLHPTNNDPYFGTQSSQSQKYF